MVETKISYDYVFVEEVDFIEYAPDTFGALVKSFRTCKDAKQE
ncbi:MAG: hypothetical protein Q8O19_04560 [Rectinemataceae bacterium]|nr:hypothetical protein [Rectinemataceae bacterium]